MLLAHTAPILRNHSLKKMAKDSLTLWCCAFVRNCEVLFAQALLVHGEKFPVCAKAARISQLDSTPRMVLVRDFIWSFIFTPLLILAPGTRGGDAKAKK